MKSAIIRVWQLPEINAVVDWDSAHMFISLNDAESNSPLPRAYQDIEEDFANRLSELAYSCASESGRLKIENKVLFEKSDENTLQEKEEYLLRQISGMHPSPYDWLQTVMSQEEPNLPLLFRLALRVLVAFTVDCGTCRIERTSEGFEFILYFENDLPIERFFNTSNYELIALVVTNE
jgi:hypothetical protein